MHDIFGQRQRTLGFWILLFLCGGLVKAQDAPIASEGLMDLRTWNWEDGSVELKGDWGFHWNKFLPADFEDAWVGEAAPVQHVPQSWNGHLENGEAIGAKGFGTYTLRILLPPGEEILAFKIPPIRSAFKLWVNGEAIASAGTASDSKTAYSPAYSPGIFAIQSSGSKLDLVLHASNFDHRNGGIGFAIKLGTNAQIIKLNRNGNLYEIFLLACLFVMALYHFGIYLLRSSEHSALYFGLFCFTAFLRIPLEGQYIFYQLFPESNWAFWLKVDYMTFIMVGYFFCLFLSELYPREWNRKVLRAMTIGSAILVGLFLILPPSNSTWTVPLGQLFILTGASYTVYVVLRAIINKRHGARMMFAALLIFILFYINDILYYADVIDTGVLTTSGSFFFIIIQAFLLSYRYAKAFTLTEIYARTFQKFVPIQFLDRIAKNGISSIELGNAETEDAVVLFSDIRGFTGISEQMSPDEVFDFLNNYLSRMEPPVRQNEGFVDKYLGDAIMALFTSEQGEGSARNALKAAIDMKRALKRFNDERSRSGLNTVHAGIGLHYGEVIIGTVGGGERMDSTAIGDSVNIASRVEGLTKQYQVPILATDDVIQSLDKPLEFRIRFIDRVRVVGKSVPIGIWEISGLATDPNHAEEMAHIALFEKATKHYYKQEFTEALDAFKSYLQLVEGDRTALLYVERSRAMLREGPEPDWDGVTNLVEK